MLFSCFLHVLHMIFGAQVNRWPPTSLDTILCVKHVWKISVRILILSARLLGKLVQSLLNIGCQKMLLLAVRS